MNNDNIWDLSKFKNSKILSQLQPITNKFVKHINWPSIVDYQDIFRQFNINIKPVAQSQNISGFEEQYEPRVYLKKELQTRTYNWHDFFNALIWLKFSRTKAALNSLHYHCSKSRIKGSNRSVLENRITQFDECGAIIISDNNDLLKLIRNHQWDELFINHREQFGNSIECVVFGHAIFEKALKPYLGMTCHCILLNDAQLLRDVKLGEFDDLDNQIARLWREEIADNPVKFSAFPVLGIPGYWDDQDKQFYNNKKYFR